jgi:hypothetical protein
MKYLSNRDEFLRRSIDKIDEYKSLEDRNLDIINEDVENSGPFANDIPWGDSLLGRLINSTIRKAKIGANLVRIKSVAKRLVYEFDNLLASSAQSQLSEEDNKEFTRLKVFSFIDNLQRAVEEGASVGDIRNLTKTAISDIKNFEDFENKDNLISQIEEFLKFLEQFKDDEGGKSESDSDKEEKTGDSEQGQESNSIESMYPTMVKTLKSLISILSHYKEVNVGDSKKVETGNKAKFTYTTVAGDTIEKIQKNPKANPKKLASSDIRTKNSKVLVKFPKDNQPISAGLVLVMEGNSLLETIGSGGSPDRSNIKGGEDHLTQAFSKLKKAIEILQSPKDKGIGIDVKFLNDIVSKSLDSKSKETIKSLFVEINRYLVGDKKETLNASITPLYKESIEIISDKNKKNIVAEKIARFAKTALQFDKQGLYGGLGETGKALQSFVESIKSTMTIKAAVKSEENKTEVKKESSLFKYGAFISLLKEAEEVKKESEGDSSVGDPDVMTTSQKIKDYWMKKIDVKAFVMEKAEVVKMKEKFDKIEKNMGKSIIINGIDPVLDIVKCFNRAYKIHTTQVIPSGRSGGRVSNKTFMEYTCFGGGDPSNAGKGGGPYRNNAIFNQWESTVLDIMKERKYQPIFNMETKLKNGANMIEKAGANLRKFMSDMLDGDELYKTGKDPKGMQAQFLDKYFGYKEGDPNKVAEQTNFDGKEEADSIRSNADSIKTADLQFTKDPIKFESNDDLAKTFFALNTKDGEDFYFFIQEVIGDTAYVVYSRTFNFFEKYITQSGVSAKISKGDMPKDINRRKISAEGKENAQDFKIKATRIKIENLIGKDGLFKLKGGYEVSYLTKYQNKANNPSVKSQLSDKSDVFYAVQCYSLYQVMRDVETKEGKKRYVLDKDISGRIQTIGGFPKVSSSDNISKTLIKHQ